MPCPATRPARRCRGYDLRATLPEMPDDPSNKTTARAAPAGTVPASLRIDYGRATLDEADVRPDPLEQFGLWFDEVRASGVAEPNAMTLATVGADGLPSARIVLLKSF